MGVEQEEEEVMASNILKELGVERERTGENNIDQLSLEELYGFWGGSEVGIYLVEHSFV